MIDAERGLPHLKVGNKRLFDDPPKIKLRNHQQIRGEQKYYSLKYLTSILYIIQYQKHFVNNFFIFYSIFFMLSVIFPAT